MPHLRRGFPVRALALAALLAGGALACATTQEVRQTEFSEIQKHYTKLVRWSQFDRAREFVDPEAVGAFESQAAHFGRVQFTDYAIRGVTFSEDGSTATVRVTYYAYVRTALVAFAFDEEQEWSRPDGRAWRVRSSFAQRDMEPGEGMF
ncbi:MAG TPA: hypothetical protein VLC53_18515 [Myxococcota bacterium]|jgi:hypothetical protein|nr:hypothetical protein [Myxococcota bacterium]